MPRPIRIAVAAPNGQARDAALEIGAAGGNAVAAAVAAALVAASTEVGIVSLMGGAFVNIWAPGEQPVVIDGNVEMPGRGLPADRFGKGMRKVVTSYGGGTTMYAGAGSVATPGTISAFASALEQHSDLDWAHVVEPAIHAARGGYVTGRAGGMYLELVADDLYGHDEATRKIVRHRDGHVPRPGEITHNPDLADTLEISQRVGPDLFTTGEVGRELVALMEQQHGLITTEDLASYRPVTRPATLTQISDWTIATNPPPSIGGPLLAVMLSELARRIQPNASRSGDELRGRYQVTAADAADILEVQRAVLGYRTSVLDFSRNLEADGVALLEAAQRYGLDGLPTSSSTAHVSVVDGDGMACSITLSSGYGAGVTIPGTGIMLNNALGEIELNRLGLHAVAPGTRLASNMAPTTGRTADGRAVAVGSPGADRITTALMQMLSQACLRHTDLQSAVDAPRMHVRTGASEEDLFVDFEDEPEVEAAIVAAGLPHRNFGDLHMYFGGVGAAYLREDGVLEAAGDPRREAAIGVS